MVFSWIVRAIIRNILKKGTQTTVRAMEHILERHSFSSTAKNVSRFLEGMHEKEISALINKAETAGREWISQQNGYRVLESNLGKIIGSDTQNKATSWLRVVRDEAKKLITAYPIASK